MASLDEVVIGVASPEKAKYDESGIQSKLFLQGAQSLKDMQCILRDEFIAERAAVNSLLVMTHDKLLNRLCYNSCSHMVGNGCNVAASKDKHQSIVHLGELPARSIVHLGDLLPHASAAMKVETSKADCYRSCDYPAPPHVASCTSLLVGNEELDSSLLDGTENMNRYLLNGTEKMDSSLLLGTEKPENVVAKITRQNSMCSKTSLPSMWSSRGTNKGQEKPVDDACSSPSKKYTSSIRKIRSNAGESRHHSRFRLQRAISKAARSELFELFFAILIALNTVVMCAEAQYWGFDSGYQLRFEGMTQPASEVWLHASTVFKVLDIFFGVAFTAEVAVKVVGLRCDFIWSWWNWFDTLIIASWLLHALFEGILPVNPFTLRVARLARLVRILRLVKTLQVFDILHLMAASLEASVFVLLWSVVLLIGIMMSLSLVMVSLIDFYVNDSSVPEPKRLLAFSYFGTFSRAFLSSFELTLGNWVPVTRFLHDSVSEWFGPFLLVYHCIVSFAVVMVIRGVFLHETFQAAGESDELMILRQGRYKKKLEAKMHALFIEADESGDGYLSRPEFTKVMNDPRVKIWLEAMGLEVRDTEHVFEVMQTGDNRITAREFSTGFARLRGSARSIDVVQVLRLNRAIVTQLQDVGDMLGVPRRHQPAGAFINQGRSMHQSVRQPVETS